MIKLTVAFLLYVGFLFPVYATVTIDLSDEAFGNNTAGRTAAAALDDAWVDTLPQGAFSPDLFANGSGYNGSNNFTHEDANYRIDWQVGYINDAGTGTPTSTDFTPINAGRISYGASRTLQGSAPSPLRDETRLSTSYSAPGLNAIQLNFANSTTPINEFGIFIGDAESRPNNGTVARILVFDVAGTLLEDYPIIYTGSVVNGSNYTVVEPLGSPSGAANNDKGDWGNDTTVFVSIKSETPIGAVIFQTGDDDHTSSNNGTSEQIALVGLQLPKPAKPPNTANAPSSDPLTLHKTVQNLTRGTPVTSTQNTALPGDTLQYRITYQNTGNEPLTDITLNDPLPAFTQLIAGSLRCDTTPATLLCQADSSQNPDILWHFSGTLQAGEQGSISYQVIIE